MSINITEWEDSAVSYIDSLIVIFLFLMFAPTFSSTIYNKAKLIIDEKSLRDLRLFSIATGDNLARLNYSSCQS